MTTRQKKVDTSSVMTSQSIGKSKKKKVQIEDYKDLVGNVQYIKISDGLYAIQYKNIDSQLQYNREDIIKLIDAKDVKGLRKVSRYFYYHSGVYKRLLHHMANMLTYDYLVVPSKQTYRKIKTDKFETYFDKSINFADDLYIKDTFSKISELVFLNGAFFGYYRELGDTKAIQELPIDYCRTRAKVDGVYQVQFDVRYFDLFRDVYERKIIFNQFPDEFLESYIDYKDGKKEGKEPWFIDLNPEFAMCYQFDDYGIPFFIGVFEDLVELVDYKLLEKAKTKMDLKKLVVQKLPMDEKTGEVLLELPDAQALHANLIKMLQNNDYIDGISSPCPIEAVNLQDNSNKAQRDNISTAENNVFSSAGFSKSILNAEGNLSLKVSVENDESISFRLLDMYARWLNNKLEYIIPTGQYYFEIFFPPVTIYNRKEMVDIYKEQATYGYAKLLPPVCAGIKQSTVINMIHFEDYLGLDKILKPLMSSHTQSGAGGRPESDESNLGDAGTKTKNTGGNEGRV